MATVAATSAEKNGKAEAIDLGFPVNPIVLP